MGDADTGATCLTRNGLRAELAELRVDLIWWGVETALAIAGVVAVMTGILLLLLLSGS